MEKVELKVTMEPERLDALRYFLSVKEKSTPQKELERALEGLYEKYVPAEMREYLDSKCRPAAAVRAPGGRPEPARLPVLPTLKRWSPVRTSDRRCRHERLC